ENLVNGARASVLMEMYHLTDTSVVQCLVDARTHGISVEVVLDGSSLKKSPYKDLEKEMISSGVSVFESSPAFSISHSKAMVIDHKKALISSMKLTDRPDVRRDYGVIVEDPGVIAEMEKVFRADIENSKNSTGFTPKVNDPHLIWSPT